MASAINGVRMPGSLANANWSTCIYELLGAGIDWFW